MVVERSIKHSLDWLPKWLLVSEVVLEDRTFRLEKKKKKKKKRKEVKGKLTFKNRWIWLLQHAVDDLAVFDSTVHNSWPYFRS